MPPAARPQKDRVDPRDFNALEKHVGWDRDQKHAHALFHKLRFESAFQPIFSLAHRRPIGHEGLLRAYKNRVAVPPLEVFAGLSSTATSVEVDRLCRLLHLHNFASGCSEGWLFLNVNARALVCYPTPGQLFGELLRKLEIPGRRIVIEVLEDAISDRQKLVDLVGYYRSLGCLIAIDDFGAGQSNFDRVWAVAPEFVKLDRSMVVQATREPRVRRMLPSLVSVLHEAGSLVVMEGIETETEALIAMDSDIDLVQGYLFGRPQAELLPADVPGMTQSLCDRFRDFVTQESAQHRDYLDEFKSDFANAVRGLEDGRSPAACMQDLLAHPRVLRGYLLDAQGDQVGGNYHPASWADHQDPRFIPLASVTGANWSRRPYFRRAIENLGQTQVTRPYFSLTDARLVITLSRSFGQDEHRQVFCCDIEPYPLDQPARHKAEGGDGHCAGGDPADPAQSAG